MKRFLSLAALTALLASAVQAQDIVTYRDPIKKAATPINGVVQDENSNRVQVKPNIGPVKDIPAVDVIDIFYELKGQVKFDYRRADNAEKAFEKSEKPAERKKLLADALAEYTKLLPQVKDTKLVARHLEYKVAYLTARAAADDKSQIPAAIDALAAFRKSHGNSWQILPCLRTLAQLYKDQNKVDDAVAVFDELLKQAGISPETKSETELAVVGILRDGKKFTEAEKRLTTILKTYAANDPKAENLRLMLLSIQAHSNPAQAIKTLEGVINESKDRSRIAMAYNTLGDCYQQNNQPKEALYQYLWVDLVYNENPIEHRRACEQLAKLFGQLKRTDRAKEYQEKVDRLK